MPSEKRYGRRMNEEIEREGACSCGALRYRMAGEPMFVHCCHCTECQQQTGSAFAVNALIEPGRLSVTSGEPAETRIMAGSGNPLIEIRCADCSGVVWMYYAGAGRRIAFVRTGTLDQPSRIAPDIHIFTRSKQPWVALPENVPAKSGFYDRAKIWPQDRLERRERALAEPTEPQMQNGG